MVKRMNVRLPDCLKARLKESADANHRTMNGEVIALLEQAMAAKRPRDE